MLECFGSSNGILPVRMAMGNQVITVWVPPRAVSMGYSSERWARRTPLD